MQRKVVLTVPHAVCPDDAPSFSHMCDFLAPDAANCIYTVSKDVQGNEIEVVRPFVPTHTSRDECDLNRRWCNMNQKKKSARDHPFRKRVKNFVLEHTREVIFVLDVHSYPPHLEKWKDYLLVVLEDNNGRISSYVKDFVWFMNKSGIPTTYNVGNNNDLHLEMRTVLGKRSMLLEFNEVLTGHQNFMKICRLIVLWFNRL